MTEPHAEPTAAEGELTATEVLQELAAAISRLNLRIALGVFALAVNVVLAAVVGIGVLRLQDIAETNQATLGIVRGATSDESRASSAASLTTLVSNLYGELGCDSRRQQARLAAAPPGQCRANTPRNIYPGIDGQPPRG